MVETLRLLALCRLARPGSPAALPKGPGGAPHALPIALLRTLWPLSLQDMPGTRARVLLAAWPALAAACGLPANPSRGADPATR